MDFLTSMAASGLRSRMESLDMLANNMANGATDGFKADREFYSLYLSEQAQASTPGAMPVVERQWTDLSQGTLRETGNPLDLALSGSGFFSVNGPSGALYTRNGSFRLSPGGEVVTAEGYPLRLTDGKPLTVQSARNLEVTAAGAVRQGGQTLGQLDLVDLPNGALSKRGNNYFMATVGSQKPAAASAAVQQGQLEGSNSNVAENAIRLVSVMRQFEMLQKAISLGAEMNRRAVEEVAKVGS